jgi:GTP-binding protein
MVKVEKAKFIKSVFYPEDLPDDGLLEIAFAGRSNVGKSSLINTLLRQKGLARVSSTPGKTRSINIFLINDNIRFVDLPGYGYARVPDHVRKGWKRLVEAYFQRRKGLCLVVVIFDIRRTPSEMERDFLKWIAYHKLKAIVVATKADKLTRHNRFKQITVFEEILGIRPVLFSSLTGEGRKELWREIEVALRMRSLKNEEVYYGI